MKINSVYSEDRGVFLLYLLYFNNTLKLTHSTIHLSKYQGCQMSNGQLTCLVENIKNGQPPHLLLSCLPATKNCSCYKRASYINKCIVYCVPYFLWAMYAKMLQY